MILNGVKELTFTTIQLAAGAFLLKTAYNVCVKNLGLLQMEFCTILMNFKPFISKSYYGY